MSRSLDAEDFDRALELMAIHGWRKGSAQGPDGDICAARALNMATRQRCDLWCDLDQARKYLGLDPQWGDTQAAIPRWNDAPSTSWRDVGTRFRSAAARLRGFASGDPRDDT